MTFPQNLYEEEAKRQGKSAEYIKALLDYAIRLDSKKLPVIFSLRHFAEILGVEPTSLDSYRLNTERYYKEYSIQKKSGNGVRYINTPFTPLKQVQSYIKNEILDNIDIHPNAFGFCKGKSIVDNARCHLNAKFILKIDLKDFFHSIDSYKIYRIFSSIGYAKNLSVYLAELTTVPINNLSRCLPQGAPTSPVLSNIASLNLDKRFKGFADKNDIKYSRYADDITFSGEKNRIPKMSFIKRIIREEGFKINEQKTKQYDEKCNRRYITGLLVDSSIRVPQKTKKDIFRHLHFCKKFGVKEHIKHLHRLSGEEKGYYYEWLKGKIAFVNMVEPSVATRMYNDFNEIDWGIK